MADALHISDSIAEELQHIADTPPENLRTLAAELEKKSTIIQRRELIKIFRDVLGSTGLNSRIVSNLASLNLLRDDPEKTPESILESLISGCVASDNEDLAESLSRRRVELLKLLNSRTLYMSVKASQLFTLGSHHMHSVKIVCDARPIFDPQRNGFPAAILFSTLHITSSDESEKEKLFSVALRSHELDEIIDECKRAKRKLANLQEELSTLEGKVIVQYGDSIK